MFQTLAITQRRPGVAQVTMARPVRFSAIKLRLTGRAGGAGLEILHSRAQHYFVNIYVFRLFYGISYSSRH